MPPKKTAPSKAKAIPIPAEPERPASWMEAVTEGVWSRSPAELPDAAAWQTWGTLREFIIAACHTINIRNSPAADDAFMAELLKLAPAKLACLALPQSDNLTRLVLSPAGTLPSLTSLDLSQCALSYLFLQSATLRVLNLSHDSRLAKAIIQCGALDDLAMRGCISLISLLLWSDKLAKIDLRDSLDMEALDLRCPLLDHNESHVPRVQQTAAPPPPKEALMPIAVLMKGFSTDVDVAQHA